MLARLLAAAADVQSSPLLDAPVTTGAIFLTLTGAITYLYRARDKDRESEHERLIQTIETMTEELRQLRDERRNR